MTHTDVWENIKGWIIPVTVIGGVLWNIFALPSQIYADLDSRYASKSQMTTVEQRLCEIDDKLWQLLQMRQR